MNADKVESFKDLIEKLPEELHRQRYILHRTENGADLICLSDYRPYTILSAVFINMDMEVTVYNNEQIVPSSSYNHIMPTSKVTMVSHVSNLLAFAKNLDLKKPAAEEQFKANMFKLINSFLFESENEQQISILQFFMEQIDLAFSNKYRIKYSSDLLMIAYVLFATSPRAYELLVEEKILIFPSIKTLKKITLNLDSKTGIDDKQYLTLCFSQLNAFDRNVIMMIDEIYLAKRVEASGGRLTDNCQVATTGLCFMIKSLSSSYQDMIAIHSVRSLKAERLMMMIMMMMMMMIFYSCLVTLLSICNVQFDRQKKCFDKIMLLLHEVGFNVIGICVDNAAANRKFYNEFFCGGCWQSSIKNSFSGERIFLLFDPTHIVKNIYNNFLTKKVFKMPMLSPILSQNLTARFSDVKNVYDLERHKPLRIAHKLTKTVLNPKTIEKVNVKHAMSLLHESTCTALKQYGFIETQLP